jgi:hypothetical protein
MPLGKRPEGPNNYRQSEKSREFGAVSMARLDEFREGAVIGVGVTVAQRPMAATSVARLGRSHVYAPTDDGEVIEQYKPNEFGKAGERHPSKRHLTRLPRAFGGYFLVSEKIKSSI